MVVTYRTGTNVVDGPHMDLTQESLWYSMYGHVIRSTVPLPLPPERGITEELPAWVFNRPQPGQMAPAPDGPIVAQQRCEHGTVNVTLSRGPGGAWFWHRSIATCHVSPDARRVDVYPEPGVEDSVLGLLLTGHIATFVLNQLGYPSLHASAVLTKHGAAAFLGPKGRGKSTMAASFLRRGATLLTDDTLPLRSTADGVLGMPGVPVMKLWPQAAKETLADAEDLPHLSTRIEKRLLALTGRFTFAEASVPLRGIYVLDRYDPLVAGDTACRIRMLGGQERLTALIAQTSGGSFLQPMEVARLLPLYARLAIQAPVRVLSYPAGFARQEAVHAAILADLEAR